MVLKLKVNTVDGEKRVAAYVGGVYKEEADCHSQFSVAQAKTYLKGKYQ